MSPEKALYELLCDLFAAHELHRFIQHHFKRLARDLPEGTSIANLAHTVAGLLQRHGHITLDLFERLAGKHAGGFLVGSAPTYADILAFDTIDANLGMKPGILDGYPNLRALVARVREIPGVAAYLAARQ